MTLSFEPVEQRFDLIPSQTQEWIKRHNMQSLEVAEIDPKLAGGNELCETFDISPEIGGNCVVLEAKKGEERFFVACLTPVSSLKSDFNGAARKAVGAKKIKMANLQEVLDKTGMEFGSITPIGLPDDWIILIDASLAEKEWIIVGSGLKKSKCKVLMKELLPLDQVTVLEGLALYEV